MPTASGAGNWLAWRKMLRVDFHRGIEQQALNRGMQILAHHQAGLGCDQDHIGRRLILRKIGRAPGNDHLIQKRVESDKGIRARVLEDLAGDWRRLDERIEGLSSEIEVLARQDAGCERLMSVPGIGPIISSAMVAAIGGGNAFSKGRDFAAWLGLVPKQISTGDRTILGKISKRGNRYLRVL